MDFFAENGWIGWIIIGGLAGAVAKFLMPGKDGGGFLMTIILGIAGAVIMGFLGSLIGWYDAGEGPDFIAAVLGAILILFIYRKMNSKGNPTPPAG
jgi:uncharacterized membrane protein YeaQ/YmgE (transglycosylase-associated protein family)